MLKRCHQMVLSLLCGSLLCLLLASVTNADGRVFVLDLKNSSGLLSFRDAERACASRHARLASPAELRHAVVECFFSTCTRGWLYGGTVGTTVCNDVRGTLKAEDVKTENATEDAARLDAFCIKDKGTPCGDPPSFPNARLQGHSGYEMGDELLYTCVPGYVMPSGHSAFSLLCDSCGEWYGLVEICVKDETESHIDYEDKFTDSYGETEHHHERLEEAQGEVHEEVHGAAYLEGTTSQEQQETSFSVEDEDEHHNQRAVHKLDEGAVEAGPEEERAVEDSAGHPRWEQERTDGDTADLPAATEEPVSLLSQKHLFWFPSEAFQDEGHPVSSNPVTSQRASGAQSEESQENESQESQHHQHPVDVHDQETDSHDDAGDDDAGDDDAGDDDGRHHELEDHDSHQEEEDLDDWTKHYTPPQHEDLDRRDHHESRDHHDEHYDMGEHENDQNHVRYGSQDYDDQDDTYDEHESYEDLEDVTEDPGADDEDPDSSKEHIEDDDQEDHYDEEEEDDHDGYTDHDDHEHDDHDDHESHEDVHGSHQHVIFSVAADDRQNVTQDGEGEEATTDETWLDGYPVNAEETETGDSTTDGVRPEEAESTIVVRITDRPNEVEISRPTDYTSSVEASDSPTEDPASEQEGEEETWPEPTAGPSPDHPQPSDQDTQQVAPTHSWLGDLTDRPFPDHEPSAHDGDILTGENTVHDLSGETGERGEIEGEMGETVCTGENCPPPTSSHRGATLAAIIVALCVVAAAVVIGVWCYRRQQQKSSMYELNGKGQSQTRQGQQIEMQQKV
ncbi:uncharacterized protein V6R79_009129 [Siganus canaliculatus]